MRKNEYDDLEQFIYEYCSGPAPSDDTHGRKYMGIEFEYHKTYYRMCREPLDDAERPVLANNKLGYYNVTIMHCDTMGYPMADYFESIGWYSDIYDLMEHCIIGGKTFKDIIMADDTVILGQD